MLLVLFIKFYFFNKPVIFSEKKYTLYNNIAKSRFFKSKIKKIVEKAEKWVPSPDKNLAGESLAFYRQTLQDVLRNSHNPDFIPSVRSKIAEFIMKLNNAQK